MGTFLLNADQNRSEFCVQILVAVSNSYPSHSCKITYLLNAESYFVFVLPKTLSVTVRQVPLSYLIKFLRKE